MVLEKELTAELAALRQEIEALRQERDDLELLLETTTEHSDTLEEELHNKAEEALSKSEQQLRMIVEATPVPVLISRVSDGQIIYANAMAGPSTIDVDDSERVLRAIRLTDDATPIDLVLHTAGGMVLAAEQIAEALAHHPARVTVFIPHYAMSGGTLIALAADQIVMDRNAVVGPMDPLVGGPFNPKPAASVVAAVRAKGRDKVDDETLILADQSAKALTQVKRTVKALLRRRFDEAQAEPLADLLTQGTWTHDYPISLEELVEMGLEVDSDMPETVYRIMSLYPQPRGKQPSVQYTPLPQPERKRK